jgi:hypothetical protein
LSDLDPVVLLSGYVVYLDHLCVLDRDSRFRVLDCSLHGKPDPSLGTQHLRELSWLKVGHLSFLDALYLCLIVEESLSIPVGRALAT